MSSDAALPTPPASPSNATLKDLARATNTGKSATLETLPDVNVFDDGEVEMFLAFVAEQRRATPA